MFCAWDESCVDILNKICILKILAFLDVLIFSHLSIYEEGSQMKRVLHDS